jgi:hypothetical protein
MVMKGGLPDDLQCGAKRFAVLADAGFVGVERSGRN